MPYIQGPASYTSGAIEIEPVVGGRPGETTINMWPELTLLHLDTWDVLSKCNGALLVFNETAAFLTGAVYIEAIKSGLWTDGLKVYKPEPTIEPNVAYGAVSGAVSPTSRTSSPPGSILAPSLLLGNKIHGPSFFRIPKSVDIRVWGIVTKASGSGVAGVRQSNGSVMGIEQGPYAPSLVGQGFLTANAIDWKQFQTGISTFSDPVPSFPMGYGVLHHFLSFGSFKELMLAGRDAYLAKAAEGGSEIGDVLQTAFNAVLNAQADFRTTFGLPLLSLGGSPFAMPTERWRRGLLARRYALNSSFLDRPSGLDAEGVTAWETALDDGEQLYLDTGANLTCSRAPNLPTDGVLMGIWGYDAAGQEFGCVEMSEMVPFADLVSYRDAIMLDTAFPVAKALAGYFPGWEIRHPLAVGTTDVDLGFTLTDVRRLGMGGGRPAVLDQTLELDEEKALVEGAIVANATIGEAFGTLLPAVVAFTGAVEKAANDLLEEG